MPMHMHRSHHGALCGSLGGKRLATALRRAQQQCAAARDSGTVVLSNVRGRLGPQLAAGNEGMGRGGTRQPWSDARVVGWPESRRRWVSAGAGEGIGESDPDRGASGGGD
jgi:hypothetical protein